MPVSLTLNGQCRQCTEGTTLDALLAESQISMEQMTVLLNGSRIPRGEHGKKVLHDGDVIEVVRWISGG